MPGFHSPRSPSSAHRWRKCPASIKACEGLPDTAGEEAIQGTVFHDYAADCAELGLDPQYLIGDRMLCEDGAYRDFSKEMAHKMLPGLDFIWALADLPGAQLFVETRLDLSPWLGPKEFGTGDIAVVDIVGRRITAFDWKWGAGVPVHPEWNDQAVLYTLGIWNTIAQELFEDAGVDPSEIEVMVVIEQPRAPGGGGIWTTQLSSVLAEGKRIKIDADRTRDPDAPFNPGEDQCKFCTAGQLNVCKARVHYIADMLGLDEDELEEGYALATEIDLVEIRALTPEQRSQILLNRKLIEKWLESLHEEVMADSLRGNPTPGLKRVLGRNPARKWADDEKAEVILSHDFYGGAWNKKLRSPAMIEEEVGLSMYRERYARHVAEGEAKPILVPSTDPRQPLISHSEMLDELWETTEATDTNNQLI
jgi:hypothetical protein